MKYLLRFWDQEEGRDDERYESHDDAYHAQLKYLRDGIACDVIYNWR